MQGRAGRDVRQVLSVGIAGGSLGGLTAALVLRDLGCRVDVYERSSAELESRGAGIVVLDETSRYLRERTDVSLATVTTATSVLRYLDADGSIVYEGPRAYRYSGWHTIYRALRHELGPDRYHMGRHVTGFLDRTDRVTVTFADGRDAKHDLLVCADGVGSSARARLVPDAHPAYAGYVAWRGTVTERDLPGSVLAVFRDALVYQVIPAGHILVYPIPALDGSTEPGRRLLNFVWYRNYDAAALDDLMTGRDGVRRSLSLPPGAARDDHVAELRNFARKHLAWPIADVVTATAQPFAQAIFDIEVERMAFGHVCLIGDAAFAIRPHIAAGTAKAAADAWALAEALDHAAMNLDRALPVWEARQLGVGRAALERARRNGNRSQFDGTWVPGDPGLDFGLRATTGP